jgi:multimeric flavodoxin WrbA
MKKILVLNGSISGQTGNTQYLIDLACSKIENCEILHLLDLQEKKITSGELKNKLKKADAFIFASGTYWDSWGSPMQNFLEVATEYEASDIFIGKPAAVIITMHSVGGKGVLSRLQGVLNTLGMLIPPMSGMVYSLAGQLSLTTESSFAEDFWSQKDIDVIVHNLLASLGNKKYLSWPVDHNNPKRIWIK